MSPSFHRFGPAAPLFPLVLSVPHAGRAYPADLAQICRLTAAGLRPLEDRFADLLAQGVIEAGYSGIIAQHPRAWIDLNRKEEEIDPEIAYIPAGMTPFLSAKLRGGLGLIPSRIGGASLWRDRLSAQEVIHRLEQLHRPYHRELEQLLDAALARFGIAILLDLHSMPPPKGRLSRIARIVIGDRHGKSASYRFSHAAMTIARDAGFSVAQNDPYAGGHILAQHGQPKAGVHAIQLEIDRSLYLDAALDQPSAGLATMQNFVVRMVDRLSAEALSSSLPLAAE